MTTGTVPMSQVIIARAQPSLLHHIGFVMVCDDIEQKVGSSRASSDRNLFVPNGSDVPAP